MGFFQVVTRCRVLYEAVGEVTIMKNVLGKILVTHCED